MVDKDFLRAKLLKNDFTDSEVNQVLPLLDNCQKREKEFLLRWKPSHADTKPQQFRGLKLFRIEVRTR